MHILGTAAIRIRKVPQQDIYFVHLLKKLIIVVSRNYIDDC